jgi:hypothetical protein
MARKFSELEGRMSPKARAESEHEFRKMLAEMPLHGEASQLADMFDKLSAAVEGFRLSDHVPSPSPDQLALLKNQAQQLEALSQKFTAQAIGATLQSIQRDLANIKALTGQAKDQLSALNNVSKAISIAASALALGRAIAGGNQASIAPAVEGLDQVLAA